MVVSDKQGNNYEYIDNGRLLTSSKETKRSRLETGRGCKNGPFTST